MNEAKRIAFLPIWGKLNETIPRQQMAALAKKGHVAQYGAPGARFPLLRTCLAFRPHLISLDWIHQYTLSPGFLPSLVKTSLFVLDVWLTRLLFRPVLIWTLHNLHHHDPRPRGLERWVSRFFARNCRRVRILGRGQEEEITRYLQISPSQLRVVPEGPYIGWYPEGCSRTEARKKLNLTEHDRVWLYLGTIRPYKGVEQLIEAFLGFEDPDLRLLIAGNPWNESYARQLESLGKGDPRIRFFTHSIPDPDLQYFYGAADLVVLPFREVLNSGSVLLAMGFGKAVVAPKKGLIPFRLSRQAELLFDENRPLIRILSEIRTKPNAELEAIGIQNRQAALSYTWDDFAHFLQTEMA